MANAQLARYWAACVEQLKDRINNRTFWAALEQTVAITVDNDVLVLGLAPEHMAQVSTITQASTMHVVSKVVQEIFAHPLEVVVIEGLTPEDWGAHKEREAQLAAVKQQALSRKPSSTSGSVNAGSWEAVYEQIARLHAQFPYRALPQGKARFANEALYMLLDAMETLYPNPPDDTAERSLARMLERIANTSEIPSPVLAFELERLRAWRANESTANQTA